MGNILGGSPGGGAIGNPLGIPGGAGGGAMPLSKQDRLNLILNAALGGVQASQGQMQDIGGGYQMRVRGNPVLGAAQAAMPILRDIQQERKLENRLKEQRAYEQQMLDERRAYDQQRDMERYQLSELSKGSDRALQTLRDQQIRQNTLEDEARRRSMQIEDRTRAEGIRAGEFGMEQAYKTLDRQRAEQQKETDLRRGLISQAIAGSEAIGEEPTSIETLNSMSTDQLMSEAARVMGREKNIGAQREMSAAFGKQQAMQAKAMQERLDAERKLKAPGLAEVAMQNAGVSATPEQAAAITALIAGGDSPEEAVRKVFPRGATAGVDAPLTPVDFKSQIIRGK